MSAETATWILGVQKPEMERIETILRAMGARIAYATKDGQRVRPGNAYRADPPITDGDYITVECGWVGNPRPMLACDHHRQWDRGYGRPPGEFLRASSLGQVIERLAAANDLTPLGWERVSARCPEKGVIVQRHDGAWMITDGAEQTWCIPTDIVYAAAADHCTVAACAGWCPGVDPDGLMRWFVAGAYPPQPDEEEK